MGFLGEIWGQKPGMKIFGAFLFSALAMLSGNSALAKPLLPENAGFYHDWAGTYADTDEYPANDADASYNSVSAESKQSYNFENPADSGIIEGVRAVAYAKVNGSDPEKIRLFLRIGGYDYEAPTGCDSINNSVYTECSFYWEENPQTGSNWTEDDLAGLEAGFKTEAVGSWDGSEHRVSQFYLGVNFKAETKVAKYHVLQKLIDFSGPTDDQFVFSIADPIDEVRSAFLEIKGVTIPLASVDLSVSVNDSAGSPEVYDAAYNINATGRPASFKILHDVTGYFKSFVNGAGSYPRYIHLSPTSNIYLLNAKLTIVYTKIIIPSVSGVYPAKGEVVSAIFDTTGTSDGPSYNSIMWKGALNGGKVRLQFAASGDASGPWTFYGGSSCSPSDWYEPIDQNKPVELGCFSAFNNKRYFRYKIQICSGDCLSSGDATPQVNDTVVNWSP